MLISISIRIIEKIGIEYWRITTRALIALVKQIFISL